ncbi:sporulation membrane protein YtaF [Bacillus solimangrovi]|uniref:Sporulation membrane protein YtaF n=1 Tax=Bacillus solimangrovi TaxID=1305675 RepID=A0A1E5LCQ8_9BACI|nr:sporulation membrane protein YtaF [Bacillus solimangrovi]OEH91867.1 sporulation membrane protein YtaF [Bacillus solimangrovi]
MGYFLSLLLLALAVSLDSFSVGFTYGLRKMSLPLKSIFIIACCTIITMLIAMAGGTLLALWLSPSAAERVGGIVLMGIGAWVLYQFFRPERENEPNNEPKVLLKFEIKSIGLVIQILRNSMVADIDGSGTITGIEAFLLGFALSLDAFGAGIGAALIGYSPIMMALLTALMSSIFVTAGLKCGKLFANVAWMQRFSFVPGILLIILGMWKI